MADDRLSLLQQVRKEFGPTSMFLLGREERFSNIKVRSTGSLLLDYALGGGYPHGRVVELRGVEKSGKTTLMNLAIAEAQRNEPEKQCCIIDLEHSYNPEWATLLGVDVDNLFFAQPETYAEGVFGMMEYLVKSGQFSIIGLDSVAGLITKAEFEEEDWDKEGRVGGASRLNAHMVRKIINSGALTTSGSTLIFINQLRDKIGGFSMYGTPTDTPGGRSLKHCYTQQLDVSIGELFTKGSGAAKEFLGQQIKVRVAKNKIAPPYKVATVDLYYEYGMDKIKELISVAKVINVLVGSAWLSMTDPRTGEVVLDDEGKEIKFNGVNKARDAIVEDIENNGGELYCKLNDLVQEVMRGDDDE